jgi:hypothetical protein
VVGISCSYSECFAVSSWFANFLYWTINLWRIMSLA